MSKPGEGPPEASDSEPEAPPETERHAEKAESPEVEAPGAEASEAAKAAPEPKVEPQAAEKAAAKQSFASRVMGFFTRKPAVEPAQAMVEPAGEPEKSPAVAVEDRVQERLAVTKEQPLVPQKPAAQTIPVPGAEDVDAVMARMADGATHLGLALARSYLDVQAKHLPPALQFASPKAQVQVPLVPLPAPAGPPPDDGAEIPLKELLKGRMRALRDQERKELWTKGLQFDAAVVFPNPDYQEPTGLSLGLFSLLCGSWRGPDLAKTQRGVRLREAKSFYHDVLRDETASTEEAFIEAFGDLRPWIRGRGREEDWPQTSTPKAEPSQGKLPKKEHLRCLSHGGSFRKVDVNLTPGGHGSSEPGEVYQHTLDPSLSSATDLLSLVRNAVVALLARKGFTVELVFSSCFRWIYALISAGESALEDLAKEHHFPRALDLEAVDPEATEPCDASYEPLSSLLRREGCREAIELLNALYPEEHVAVEPEKGLQVEDSVREAYCWYLRSRLKGSSAAVAKKEANSAWGSSEPPLRNLWDRLCGCAGPEVLRVSAGEAQARHFQRLQVPRLDGKLVTSRFSREDRLLLIMAALMDICDVFKLMSDGYVADVLPTGHEESDEGQACHLQLAWRRHMALAMIVPALLGIAAQVIVAWASEDWWAEILLGYALLASLWFSIALAVWKIRRKKLLLSRGDAPGSDGSFDICCGSGFVRPSDSAEALAVPFGGTRRQFKGGVRRSLISGSMEEQANPFFSLFRRGVSLLICLILASGSIALAACTCDLLPVKNEDFDIPQIQYSYAQHLVGLVVLLEIWLLNRVFRLISLRLSRWENHKTSSQFVHAYHLKALGLQLINSYASLFYIAFYPESWKLFESSHSCIYANGWWNHWGNACRMARLNKQLTTILAGFCLKVAVRCLAFRAMRPKGSQSSPERPWSSELLELEHVMQLPRFGDPETDRNMAPHCCFAQASEVIVVLGMFLLFLPASPWSGLLTLLYLQLANATAVLLQARTALPWRAGHPACPSTDLLEASDRLAGTATQAISWLAMLCMAALLVWPAQLGWGRLNSALLAEGSDLAPWGLSTALLLLCRFIPGRLVQCTTGAQRLRVAETRLCRGMQKARYDAHVGLSARSARGRVQLGTDFRVRTPMQWEELSGKFRRAA